MRLWCPHTYTHTQTVTGWQANSWSSASVYSAHVQLGNKARDEVQQSVSMNIRPASNKKIQICLTLKKVCCCSPSLAPEAGPAIPERMHRRPRQDRDLAAIFVFAQRFPPLRVRERPSGQLLFFARVLQTSRCSTAPRPRAESRYTNLYGLPPFLSALPSLLWLFSPCGPASPLSLLLNHTQMGRLETEKNNELSHRGLLSHSCC